jgi:hypothetical protein
VIASELAHELYSRGYEDWKQDFPSQMLLESIANVFVECLPDCRLENGARLNDCCDVVTFFEELARAMGKRKRAA